MELRHLKYFIAVAEELHFSRAASRLNIAQPPLSQQIRQLEQELGFPLLLRNKHHVELTEAGKVFLEEARSILAYTEQATLAARQAHQGATGKLVLGFVGSATYSIVPLLQSYRLKFPSVNLVLYQMKRENQLQALHDRRIDAGVVRTPFTSPSLAYEVMQREPFAIALPENHSLAKRKSVRIEELRNEPFIIPSRRNGSNYHSEVIRLCYQAGFCPHITLEAPEILTVVAFVSAGMGVAIVPASFRTQQNKGVVYFELIGVNCCLEMGFAWRKDEKSAVLQEFLRLCRTPQS